MQSPTESAGADEARRDGGRPKAGSHNGSAESRDLRGATEPTDEAEPSQAPDNPAHRVPVDKREAKARSEGGKELSQPPDGTQDAAASATVNATAKNVEKATGPAVVSGDMSPPELQVSKAATTKLTAEPTAGGKRSPQPTAGPQATSGLEPQAPGAVSQPATEPSGETGVEPAKTTDGRGPSKAPDETEGTTSKAAVADQALRSSAAGEIEPASVAGPAFGTPGRTNTKSKGARAVEGEVDPRGTHGVTADRTTKANPKAVSAVHAQRGDGDGSVLREIQVDLSENTSQPRADATAGGEAGRSDSTEAGSFAARMGTPPGDTASRPPTLAQAGATLGRRLNGDVGQNIVRQARVMLQESGKAEVRLIIRPPELGRVRIQLQMDNGHIAGRILVDNGSVREVVEQNLPALQRAFEEAGLEMGDLEVSTGDARQEAGTDETSRHARSSRDRRQGADQFDHSVEAIATYDYGGHRVNLVA
jgi:flagellar hook-length control protein FliK